PPATLRPAGLVRAGAPRGARLAGPWRSRARAGSRRLLRAGRPRLRAGVGERRLAVPLLGGRYDRRRLAEELRGRVASSDPAVRRVPAAPRRQRRRVRGGPRPCPPPPLSPLPVGAAGAAPWP